MEPSRPEIDVKLDSKHIYKIRFLFFEPFRPCLALELLKSANKGDLKKLDMGIKKAKFNSEFPNL